MSKITLRRAAIAAIAVTAMGLALSSCASNSGSSTDQTVVKVGVAPYFEYQPWVLAHELGLDKQQGLELQFTNYDTTDKAVVGAYRGDVDIASNCLACTFPLIKQVPDIQDFMITDQFKGFIVIGRKGKTNTFEELKKTAGDEAAKSQILNELKGKTFAIRSSSYQALLNSALSQVGLSIKDVKIADFASDSQAGIAFAGGTGDYYVGSLPQEAKLLESPDKFVNVGGSDILGPAGLWFSSTAANKKWLAANSATTDKLLAVWYRTMRYMQEKPNVAMPLFTKIVNKATSSELSVKTVTSIITDLERYATLPQAKAEFLDPSSKTYYKTSVDFYQKENKDVIPADYSQSKSIVIQQAIDSLEKDSALIKWVNKPLD